VLKYSEVGSGGYRVVFAVKKDEVEEKVGRGVPGKDGKDV